MEHVERTSISYIESTHKGVSKILTYRIPRSGMSLCSSFDQFRETALLNRASESQPHSHYEPRYTLPSVSTAFSLCGRTFCLSNQRHKIKQYGPPWRWTSSPCHWTIRLRTEESSGFSWAHDMRTQTIAWRFLRVCGYKSLTPCINCTLNILQQSLLPITSHHEAHFVFYFCRYRFATDDGGISRLHRWFFSAGLISLGIFTWLIS